MNIRSLLYLLPFLGLFVACGNDDDFTPQECEAGLIPIEEFALQDTLTYTELDDTGILYYIDSTGSAEKPALTDSVVVNYRGQVTGGRVFDQTTTATGPRTFVLGQLIRGWQLGIPLVGRGGRIRLLIPTELGYGSQGACNNGLCSVCPNSDLIFDIELIDFYQ